MPRKVKTMSIDFEYLSHIQIWKQFRFIHLFPIRRARYVVSNSVFSRTGDFNSSRVWFTENSESRPPDYNIVKLDPKTPNSSDYLPPYTNIN
ncbi:hypothetical protein BpHYR1_042342 [Brachionus plicatilis]|uniref:Uncharacterized protein n=1 Tax=Brachionus plicatilis TaxID=10195 RepID=A0A3M7SUN9_BRAPC|nr:hypothetical protein BpHYR1_042342 [Brachionus plicatilis]